MKKIYKLIIKILLKIHNKIYEYIGIFSCKLENGQHPKHRLTDYHGFFTDNIKKGDTVLDIGCGNGLLTFDVSKKAKQVTGIDINLKYIEYAKKNKMRNNIKYILGDVTKYKFKDKNDIIILSNVLEHIDKRVEFLKKIKKIAKKFLIRVPMIDRDWLTLYKKDLGVEYRLDLTHHIEYTIESFMDEIKSSGYRMQNYKINFGEIWAVLK